MRRLALILAMGLAIAACSGDEGASDTTVGEVTDRSEFASGEDTVTTPGAEEAPSGDGAIAVDLEVAQDRKVIRQAQLQLEADDTRAALDRIIALSEAAGGFVADATVHPVEGEQDQPSANITLRIPASELTGVMTAIKGSVEKVISESQGAQDVTDQFIDLEARLTNLEALEVELRALLAEVRQQPEADPDKLLRVYNEISLVRGQIEEIQGQLNYLDDVVDLATLTIGLTPTPAAVPIVEDTWEPVEVARDALRNLVTGLQGLADWGIHFALYTLPMLLLVLGVP
ncbi:MAG TPA: DUF4349 domain-containing protein, partial [Acidimicrobiia bacterium]|nr:DUF4349 domain-containing protein [Acidimicrobiia bacterium]